MLNSYIFLIMHVVFFFLAYGIYEFLYGDSVVFDAKFSKIILLFELVLYFSILLFLLGIIFLLYFYPVSFLIYELLSLTGMLFIVRKFFSNK